MTSGSGFLGGAKSRLLPASVPFRFFAAAVAFHVLLWAALLRAADQMISFRGGLAPPLAAVHMLVLGVLTTTAIGAAVQLLPVATRRAHVAHWPIKLVFWMFVPGLAVLVTGMYLGRLPLIVGGATASAIGLVLFGVPAGGQSSSRRRSRHRCRLRMDRAGSAPGRRGTWARAVARFYVADSCPITLLWRAPT